MVRIRGRKGSYFFVLDAFIAGLVILTTLVILFNSFSSRQSSVQSFLLAEDFASFLSETEIKGYTDEVVYNMTQQGAITNPELTLLQQIVLFYDAVRTAPARQQTPEWRNMTLLINEVASLAPENTGLGFYIQDPGQPPSSLFNKTLMTDEQDARILLSAQRVVSVPEGVDIIGPYVMEVRLWR